MKFSILFILLILVLPYTIKAKNSNNNLKLKDCKTGKTCFEQGLKYGKNNKTPNYVIANEYYKKACDLKHGKACNYLGISYHAARGISKDINKGNEFFKKACDLKYGNSCSNLGLSYYDGKGFPKNINKAGEFFKKACKLGSKFACDYLKKNKKSSD